MTVQGYTGVHRYSYIMKLKCFDNYVLQGHNMAVRNQVSYTIKMSLNTSSIPQNDNAASVSIKQH